jgi:hypothetical protein
MCIGEPISFLRLERHLQGEGTPDQRSALDAHLSQCSACRACYHELETDPFELAPWSSFAGESATWVPPASAEPSGQAPKPTAESAARSAASGLRALQPTAAGTPARRWRALAGAGLAGLAAAAVALLVVLDRPAESGLPGSRRRTKGGELAVELIRESAGDPAADPARFRLGDRFQLRATCPPGPDRFWDVVVFEGQTPSFPLRGGLLECGNGVALPGAFRLTSHAPHDICLMLSDTAIDRARALHLDKRALPPESVCAAVIPAGEP